MTERRRLLLRPVLHTDAPAIVLAPGESRVVGRSPQADITIPDSSLSRLHARIAVDSEGRATIEDLGSTNGTLVDDVWPAPGPLAVGQVVRFGAVSYVVGEETDEAARRGERTVVRRSVSADVPASMERAAVEALLATSRELMAFDDLGTVLDRVLNSLQTLLRPDRSAILLVDADGTLRPRAVRPTTALGPVSQFASGTVVREALASRQLMVVQDARLDPRLQAAASVVIPGVRSVLCVPLLGRRGPIGALYADKLTGDAGFPADLVQYASAFAAHAAAALETAQLYDEREANFRTTLEVFARAIDARDRYTAGHSERVTAYTTVLARVSGVGDEERETIRRAGMLHDIGKVGVSDSVLLKPGPLDPVERQAMEAHVVIGYGMLAAVPFLERCLPAIRAHHERWDGRGYPDGLAGAGIHAHARLMALADSWDAMTSARPYRQALPSAEAARRIREARGTQFDPSAVDLFDATEPEFLDLLAEWQARRPE